MHPTWSKKLYGTCYKSLILMNPVSSGKIYSFINKWEFGYLPKSMKKIIG